MDTNFVVFQMLGLIVFGLGIWVLVDKPSFLTLFEEVIQTISSPAIITFVFQAQSVSGTTDSFNVEIYTSAAYILLVVSFLVVLISFFGFCGDIKENKCILGMSVAWDFDL